MIHEMYLKKSAQYESGEYVGVDEESKKKLLRLWWLDLYLFIIFVVQAVAEVTFNGQWLTETFCDSIDNLIEIGLCVRGIVTDNHSANVNAFSILIKITI